MVQSAPTPGRLLLRTRLAPEGSTQRPRVEVWSFPSPAYLTSWEWHANRCGAAQATVARIDVFADKHQEFGRSLRFRRKAARMGASRLAFARWSQSSLLPPRESRVAPLGVNLSFD